MSYFRRAPMAALGVFALLISGFAWSGNVSVHPKRLVFEGDSATSQVYLMNLGDKPTTMRVSLKNYKMLANGRLVPVLKPGAGERFAEPYIRFSPKRVRLQPGESQIVRVRVDKQKISGVGEYRSHMAFIAEPEVKRNKPTASRHAGEAKRVKIALTPVFGMSIPVIIRHGTLNADAKIEDVDIDERSDDASIKVALGRQGLASVYGDVEVLRVRQQGKPVVLARTKGVGVYPPLNRRYVEMSIPDDKRHHLSAKSEIVVAFTHHNNPASVISLQSLLK